MGDEFAHIYKAQVASVWHHLHRLGIPHSDLEDLVQDVFVVVHRRLKDYDPERPARPWLIGIATRVALGYWRKKRRNPEPLADEPLAQDELRDPAPSPEAQVVHGQSRELVHRALNRLSSERRQVLVLHEFEGLAIPEVSSLLGIPLNTAYSRLRRGRRDFERALAQLREMGERS